MGVAFLRRVISTFANRAGYSLIVSAGDGLLASQLQPPGISNVLVTPYVPQMEVLQRCAAMITHGGANSIKECILSGVPMVVYPLRADQPGNSARVVYHGLGLRGSVRRDRVDTILRKVEQVIGDHAFHERLERMRRAFVEDEGAAVRCLEHHAREGWRPSHG